MASIGEPAIKGVINTLYAVCFLQDVTKAAECMIAKVIYLQCLVQQGCSIKHISMLCR